MRNGMRTFRNGEAFPLAEVPLHPTGVFLQGMIDSLDHGWRVSSYFGVPEESGATIYAILSFKSDGIMGIMGTKTQDVLPSIASLCPEIQLFEREIAEQCAVVPEGHPWLKPVRFHRSYRPGADAWGRKPDEPILPGVMEFYRVEGEEVHEVAVGPVHAGVIEPGHFRFQCHGEQVFHLEISLGYQHRGIEKALLGGPHSRSIYQTETIAGDTTIGHATAYCMILEALSGTFSPARAEVIRGIALELERLANHTGDLGALAGDVGYLPTASFCGRIRGDFLNMTAQLCGSRFGRGIVRPGGVGFDCSTSQRDTLLAHIEAAGDDLANAVQLMWESPSVMSRLEGTGTVTPETARDIGLVGPAARASALNRDIRRDHPFGIFRMSQIPVMTAQSGDVHARTLVRALETEKSIDFIKEQLHQLPNGKSRNDMKPLRENMVAVALTEGWRGEVCHVGITDATGRFARYKVTDPSFHNWTGLAMALRNEQISDFPLCNKSFNLSYCGFDL